MRLRVIESDFCLHVPDPVLRAGLTRQWSRCLSVPGTAASEPSLVIEIDRPGETRWLTTQLTQHAITQLLGQRLMIHSAGVADDEGRVIALVGRSGIGKSTAAAALTRSDFSYVTDETLVVRCPATVVAFPRPLRLRRQDGPEEVEWGPDELGLRECPPNLQLARIVVLDRDPKHVGPPTLAPLSLIDGILEVTPQISSLAALGQPLHWLCRAIEDCGGVFQLTYAEVEDTAHVLRRLLADTPSMEEEWTHLPVSERNWVCGLRDHRVRQANYKDAVAVDNEVLVLVGRTPVRLSGIGPALWRAALDAPTRAELLEHVVAEHGDHPQAEEMVEVSIDRMLEAGVIGCGRPLAFAEFQGRLLAPPAPEVAEAGRSDASIGRSQRVR